MLAPTLPTPVHLLAFQLYVSVVSTFCRGANSSRMLGALYTYKIDLYTCMKQICILIVECDRPVYVSNTMFISVAVNQHTHN